MKKGLTALGSSALALTLGTAPAAAQPHMDILSYFGVYGGGNWTTNSEIRLRNDDDFTRKGQFETGYVVGGVIGIATPLTGPVAGEDAPFGLRPEIDISWRKNNVDTLPRELGGVGTGRSADVSGDITALSGLFNLWIDLHLLQDIAPLPGAFGAVTPYVGGGIGASRLKVNSVRVEGERVADDRDTTLAYQLGAGTVFQFAPQIGFSIDYRFFVADDPQFTNQTGGSFTTEYENHTVTGGLRFTF